MGTADGRAGKVDSAKSGSGSGRIRANSRDGGVSDGSLPRELPSLLTLWAGGSIVNFGWEEGIHEDFSNGSSLKAPSDYKIPTV